MICFPKFFISMDSSKQTKFLIIDRLQTDTQTVHPCLSVLSQFFFRYRSRIHFHSDLCVLIQRKYFPDRIHQPPNLLTGKKRWGSASEKNGNHPVILHCIRTVSDLVDQHFHIFLFFLFSGRTGKEITICTFFHTKRNMNI